jgi:transcriptional regulator with XRE-family HTH domain
VPGDPDSRGARFAELIRTAREGRGLSQDEVAERAGVSRSTIIRWENGRAERPDPGQVRAVCQALGIDPRDAATALGYLPEPDISDDRGARFGKWLRTIRERRGLSQRDLEERSGVAMSTISRWERGHADGPDPDHIRAVCAALGVDPREAAVVLGYLTHEEVYGPPARSLSADLEVIAEILEDPAVPNDAKKEWIEYLKYLRDRTQKTR